MGHVAGRLEGKPVDGISPEMEHVFRLEDCVHLTDELIADLTIAVGRMTSCGSSDRR
jgi:hypothetical protein